MVVEFQEGRIYNKHNEKNLKAAWAKAHANDDKKTTYPHWQVSL